jgi:hypothetical protein
MGIYNFLFHGEAYAVMGGGLYQNYSYLEKANTMGHTREYTPTEVVNFLKKIGFEIDGIIYRGTAGSRKIVLAVTRIWPQFRPFFSIVASKPKSSDAVIDNAVSLAAPTGCD